MVDIQCSFRKADFDKVMKRLENINEKTIKTVISRAAKRAAATGVKEIKKQLAATTTLKTKKIGEKLDVYGGSNAAVGINLSGITHSLSDFAFTPKKPTPKTPPVVEVIKGRKVVLNKGAFVAKMKSGHVGVYERDTEKALPISQLPGPSVAGSFRANEDVNEQVQDIVFEKFEERVEKELNYLLTGHY
jgi:hypothetical protein